MTAAGIIALGTTAGVAYSTYLIRRYSDQVSPDATIPLGVALAALWGSILLGALILLVMA